MKKVLISLLILLVASVLIWNYLPRNEPQVVKTAASEREKYTHPRARQGKVKLSDILVETKGPEAHSNAIQAAEMIGDASRLDGQSAQEVLQFLRNGKPSDMPQEVWQERVNVLLNALRFYGEENHGSVTGLVDYMLDLASDSSGRILQIYALQHLASWSTVEQDKAEVDRISQCLFTIANQRTHQAAGTAVLMLSDMYSSGVITEVDQITKQAEILVAGAEIAQDVRVSAIHTCVDRKDGSALPAMRNIAQDATHVSTLRKAAIHAIGQLGTAEDLALLESLPQDDANLALAILPAKKELEKRIDVKK